MLLSLALAVVTLILAGFGFRMSESTAMSRRAKWTYRTIFGLCAAISLVLIGVQGRKADQSEKEAVVANQKLSQTLEDIHQGASQISRQQEEIARVQKLNTELQNKLLGQSGELIDSSRRISELSKQGINTSAGGDSFCYMDLVGGLNPNGSVPIFSSRGKYPIYEVHVSIFDSQKLDALAKTHKLGLLEGEIALDLGTLSTASALIPANPPTFQLWQSDHDDIRVNFAARNGNWTEDFKLRRVGDHYSRFIRVFWEYSDGRANKLIYTFADKDFPNREIPSR